MAPWDNGARNDYRPILSWHDGKLSLVLRWPKDVAAIRYERLGKVEPPHGTEIPIADSEAGEAKGALVCRCSDSALDELEKFDATFSVAIGIQTAIPVSNALSHIPN